jgi:hypothetical protein
MLIHIFRLSSCYTIFDMSQNTHSVANSYWTIHEIMERATSDWAAQEMKTRTKELYMPIKYTEKKHWEASDGSMSNYIVQPRRFIHCTKTRNYFRMQGKLVQL